MMVCKCNSCGNYIHFERENEQKCIYCDSSIEIEEINDDTYVGMRIGKCEKELGNIKALKMYDECIEKFPNVSRLYWGRLLARHSCKNDRQLLSHGINLLEDPDYMLACHFATYKERACYEKLANCRERMLSVILSELAMSEKSQIRQTGIEDVQIKAASEIEKLGVELEHKMAELDFIEKQIIDLKTDCRVNVISNRMAIDYTIDGIDRYKTQINLQKEVENDEYKKLSVEIGKLFYVCEMANADIKKIQHSDNYKLMQQLQQDQVVVQRNVDDVISQIEEVDERMRNIISKVAEIREKYKKASYMARSTSFADASSLLGSEKINVILIRALKA